MALILVLACATIAILEIYLARGARQLERKIAEQGERLAALDRRPFPVAEEVRTEAAAPQELESLKAQVARLRDDCDKLVSRLAEGEGIRRLLIRTLDREADAALGGTPGRFIVRGALFADAPEVEDTLVRLYERCAEQYGLATELRTPWHGSGTYYLSCVDPRLVEAAFLEQIRRLQGRARPEDSLYSLLHGLRGLPLGLVQLGPFLTARTPSAFRCGVLTPQESREFRADVSPDGPGRAISRLSRHPEQRGCDLLAVWTTDYQDP